MSRRVNARVGARGRDRGVGVGWKSCGLEGHFSKRRNVRRPLVNKRYGVGRERRVKLGEGVSPLI